MQPVRSQAVLLSRRSNVFYLEHARVVQKDHRVVYFTEKSQSVEQAFGIPDKNTAFLLLGKGTSITDSAMRKLAESNVMVGFCGSGGSPLFGAMDVMFMAPEDCYRPPQYAQAWMKAWMDDDQRLSMARELLGERKVWTEQRWKSLGFVVPSEAANRLAACHQGQGRTTTDLLSAEALWAKSLYATLAQQHGVKFTRQEGRGLGTTPGIEKINGYLDHGNYIAYGFAATALHGLGIPYCFPLLHGKTRRGALVFDVADLIKDGLVMPLAFEAGSSSIKDQDFRKKLIARAQQWEVLDYLMTFLKKMCEQKS